MNSGTPSEELIRQIKNISEEFGKAYCEGSDLMFELIAKDATIYSVNSTEPFRGQEAYRESFSANLVSTTRELEVLREDIQIIDDDNVLRVSSLKIIQDGLVIPVRQTQNWSRIDGEWKITHLHTSLIGSPTPLEQPSTLEGIQIINERIATVAAVLGVAQ